MRKKILANVEDEALVNVIIDAIKDKKGNKIVKLDLRDIKNTLCDFFVICEADSNTQVSALADNVEKESWLKLNSKPHHIEGRENCQWILIDFFGVIVHVFQREYREFYKLEDLWSDAKIELIAE